MGMVENMAIKVLKNHSTYNSFLMFLFFEVTAGLISLTIGVLLAVVVVVLIVDDTFVVVVVDVLAIYTLNPPDGVILLRRYLFLKAPTLLLNCNTETHTMYYYDTRKQRRSNKTS